ncbi:MAG: hypothetical protein JWP87_2514 [Labilithrix sp.]|jgi:hypothetical protein|nr:hypothetical protein [Labilithrix sp.]
MTPPREPFVVRQEPDRLARRKLALVSATSIAIAAMATASAWLLLEADSRGPEAARAPAPPAAGVGTAERTLIETTERGLTLRAAQREALEHYGWVDRDAGIARIPVERAMDMVADDPGPPNEALP